MSFRESVNSSSPCRGEPKEISLLNNNKESSETELIRKERKEWVWPILIFDIGAGDSVPDDSLTTSSSVKVEDLAKVNQVIQGDVHKSFNLYTLKLENLMYDKVLNASPMPACSDLIYKKDFMSFWLGM